MGLRVTSARESPVEKYPDPDESYEADDIPLCSLRWIRLFVDPDVVKIVVDEEGVDPANENPHSPGDCLALASTRVIEPHGIKSQEYSDNAGQGRQRRTMRTFIT